MKGWGIDWDPSAAMKFEVALSPSGALGAAVETKRVTRMGDHMLRLAKS